MFYYLIFSYLWNILLPVLHRINFSLVSLLTNKNLCWVSDSIIYLRSRGYLDEYSSWNFSIKYVYCTVKCGTCMKRNMFSGNSHKSIFQFGQYFFLLFLIFFSPYIFLTRINYREKYEHLKQSWYTIMLHTNEFKILIKKHYFFKYCKSQPIFFLLLKRTFKFHLFYIHDFELLNE